MNILQTLKKIPSKAKSIGAKILTAIQNNFFVRHFKKILLGIIVIIASLLFIRWIIVGVITKLIITTVSGIFQDFNISEFVKNMIDQIKIFFSNLF